MFRIVRVAVEREGAFGVLLCRGIPFAVTLEHTYDSDNSLKIPEGLYVCPRSVYHRGGYPTYEIPVPGHSRILFHKGNVEDDADGCILVAKSWGVFGGKPGVASSAHGFSEFMAQANDADEIELRVVNAVGA